MLPVHDAQDARRGMLSVLADDLSRRTREQRTKCRASAAAPELATQALKGLANQLPPELGAAKSLLTNDAFLKELVSNKELQGSLEKLIGGDTSAIKELLANDKARDAALTAIGNDPGIKAQLEQLGLTPEDLVAAGVIDPSWGPVRTTWKTSFVASFFTRIVCP